MSSVQDATDSVERVPGTSPIPGHGLPGSVQCIAGELDDMKSGPSSSPPRHASGDGPGPVAWWGGARKAHALGDVLWFHGESARLP